MAIQHFCIFKCTDVHMVDKMCNYTKRKKLEPIFLKIMNHNVASVERFWVYALYIAFLLMINNNPLSQFLLPTLEIP